MAHGKLTTTKLGTGLALNTFLHHLGNFSLFIIKMNKTTP